MSPRQRLRKALVTVEIALGLLLLSAAGLLIESFWRATHVDLGFGLEHVLTMRLNLPKRKYDTGRRVEAFREELLRRVSALPGVEFAGTNSAPPMGILMQSTNFEIEGKPETRGEEQRVSFANVSPDYLRAMGIPVIRGRNFQATDRQGTSPVVIISESVARRFFPNEEAVGRRLRLDRGREQWFTVIGVARDVRQNRPEDPPEATIYALSSQLPESAQGDRAARTIGLVLRTAMDPSGLARAVRAAVAEIDKDQPVADIRTMREAVGKSMAGRRLNTTLIALFAGLALALAATGVFGLVSYAVTCRTNEFGIRMALGARRSTILAMVTRETLAFGTVGIAAGIFASLAAARFLAGMLYGVKPAAPHILFASAGFLVAAMVVATVLAARRAMGVDPVVALRHE